MKYLLLLLLATFPFLLSCRERKAVASSKASFFLNGEVSLHQGISFLRFAPSGDLALSIGVGQLDEHGQLTDERNTSVWLCRFRGTRIDVERLHLPQSGFISNACFSPDGTRAFFVDWHHGRIQVYDVLTNSSQGILDLPDDFMTALAAGNEVYDLMFTTRGGLLYGVPKQSMDSKYLAQVSDQSCCFMSSALNGQIYAIGTGIKEVRLWSAETGDITGQVSHDLRIDGAIMSPDGSKIIIDAVEGGCYVGNTSEIGPTEQLTSINVIYLRNEAHGFLDEQRYILMSDNRKLLVWDSYNNRIVHALPMQGSALCNVAISPMKRRVLIARTDGRVELWSFSLIGDIHVKYDSKEVRKGIRVQ